MVRSHPSSTGSATGTFESKGKITRSHHIRTRVQLKDFGMQCLIRTGMQPVVPGVLEVERINWLCSTFKQKGIGICQNQAIDQKGMCEN